jgi:hypothetical protein
VVISGKRVEDTIYSFRYPAPIVYTLFVGLIFAFLINETKGNRFDFEQDKDDDAGGTIMANIIFGLVALALGLWGVSVWWWSIVEVLRGVVPVMLILLGIVALGAGVTRMREQNGSRHDSDELQEEAFPVEE